MSSTNKTQNYQLSQYVGTDHPSFIQDVNSDNFKIDRAIKEANDKIDSIDSISKSEADGRYVQKTDVPPASVGLTADQFDRMYVDSNNIVRVKPVEE